MTRLTNLQVGVSILVLLFFALIFLLSINISSALALHKVTRNAETILNRPAICKKIRGVYVCGYYPDAIICDKQGVCDKN